MTGKTPSPKDSKRPLPDSVAQPLAQFEAAVHGMEEQVREVNARIDKRAGRPLWLAITFGLLLGGIFVASLFVFDGLFMVFVTALVFFGTLELSGALKEKASSRIGGYCPSWRPRCHQQFLSGDQRATCGRC